MQMVDVEKFKENAKEFIDELEKNGYDIEISITARNETGDMQEYAHVAQVLENASINGTFMESYVDILMSLNEAMKAAEKRELDDKLMKGINSLFDTFSKEHGFKYSIRVVKL